MLSTSTIRKTEGRGRLFDSVLDAIGDTPAIRINNLGTDNATIYVKAEFFNPASSVKDRLAVAIIEEAERWGADLIVVGTAVHGSLFGNNQVLGSEIERVIRNAPCPVLCVPAARVMTPLPALVTQAV